MSKLITPVILSGGSGTRLWPVSTPARPKQFLSLFAPETMLQLTAARFADPNCYAAPLVVANEAHAGMIESQLARSDARIILEPHARNTAPAIALAALASSPEDLLLVCPSDHHVADLPAFSHAVQQARFAAEDGWMVCFGIHPTHPETGYGYIRRGESVARGVARAEAFVEKPNLATARAYLHDGRYSWNGGIFLFTARTYLQALGKHAPEILRAAEAAMADARMEGARILPVSDAFAASPSVSIDYAVMEKDEEVAVVPADMGWSDLGSWDALYGLGAAAGDTDDANNLVTGDAVVLDCHTCLVRGDGIRVAAVGVDNLILIATPESVLLLPRGESQRVKEATEALTAREGPSTSH